MTNPATKTTPGASDVEITINGQKVVLRATLEACLAISREGGGVYGPNSLADRLTRFDLDAYVSIIRAGLGLTGNAVPTLAEEVFRSGMVNLTKPLTTFVVGLGDPDKLRKPAEEGKGGAEAPLSLADVAAQASAEAPGAS
jgi:hypothetical protein